jgi:peptide/nickel transport system substrate-binding protein
MKRLEKLASITTLLLFAGFASAQTLRLGLQEDPDVLDPHRARTYVGRIVFTSLCDKLLDITTDLKFVPQLATSWSLSDDAKSLSFKLRNDVLFHDGSKFDASAAKANIERAIKLPDSLRKSELASVESVEAPDPTTLVLRLKSPDATLLGQLTDRAGMMLSPKSFDEADVSAVGKKPICSGPYKFVERVQNDRIVLEKFDQYYDAKDYSIKRLVFKPIPDTTVRLSNLRAGDLDLIERLSPSDAGQVKKDSALKFMPVSGLGYQQIIVNINNGKRGEDSPFKDKRVRQAFELALDKQAINDVIGEGLYPPAQQPFPPASPYFSEKYPPSKLDVTKAKALLKDAGFERVKVELVSGNNTTETSMTQLIQAMVAQAGFDLSLRPTEFAAMQKEAGAGNFDLMLIGWSGRTDPDGNIYPFVTCKGPLNDGRYCNPEMDKVLNQARAESEPVKRKALYEQMQAILQEDRPEIYLFFQPWPFATTKKVQGFVPYPDGMIRLKGVTLAP